ncbi:threonine ammonia-lyase [Sphingobium algorifonticola]|uniref:Threonine ammonia-lyase n=1 Tax=Sphingobium algorifonticola TaxID=2008318 RepID=A0A437J909_9SPHN|nr:threonine ammonia-lyase [Sphingobium algorifonticola]RVT41987.1 threonine ammonia-lyase [Sphingobium algorifonticola]
MIVTIEDVRAAAARIGSAVERTPFLHSQTLSQLTGADVWLKFENLQFTASFKERGALNCLLTLDAAARARGVVGVSAGNHAQGIAYHARRLGIPATIIMPNGTPRVKVSRTEGFGATVVLHGNSFAEASQAVPDFVARGMTFVHPFDNPAVMAGQGTVALEMMEQGPDLDTMIVAVGGGGLIGGVGAVLAAQDRPIELIGVQSELYPSMAAALGKAAPDIPGGTSVAEGIAVARPGALTLEQARAVIDDMIVVSESAIEDAIALLLQIEKTLCEGAGAAGLAALLAQPDRFRGRRVGLILCGGNIDSRVLIAVLQRHIARAGQLVRLRVTALDNAGPLGRIATLIGDNGGNILDVSHDRVFGHATARAASIDFSLELTDAAQVDDILAALTAHGFPAELMDARR